MLLPLLIMLSGMAFAQKPGASRFIGYAELRSQYSATLGLTRTSIPHVLFDAAGKNDLQLYRFDDMSKAPKARTFAEVKKVMLMRFPDWNSTSAYESYHWVQFNGKTYKCKGENIVNRQPDQNPDVWAAYPPQYYDAYSVNIGGFDYSSDGTGKPQLQFIHFYIQELYGEKPRYVASVRAGDAVKILNRTNVLLSTRSPMNYFRNDIFFFDRDDRERILADFLAYVDTTQIDQGIVHAAENYAGVSILSRYRDGKVQQLLLAIQPADNPADLLADSVSIHDIHFDAGPQKKLLRLGDALLDTANFGFYDVVSLKPIKGKPIEWTKNTIPIKKISTTVRERLTFREGFYGNYYNETTYKTLDDFLKLIFMGIEEHKIAVYDNAKLDSVYSREAIRQKWTAVQPYEYPAWESAVDYYTGDKVIWKGTTYEAVTESAGSAPDASPDHWKITPSGLVLWQPADVAFMEVHYSLVFDSAGTVISKEPVVIMIGVPGAKTPAGFDHYLGYMKYSDITAYLSANSNAVLTAIRAMLERQNGVFHTVEYGELIASDQ